MPATSRSQQRLFCMALAVRKGDLPRNKANDAVLKIVDGKMTNKQIEDFTVLKENEMIHLKDYINESVLSSTGSGKMAVVNKIVGDEDFTTQNIAMLEKEVSVWKPKYKSELMNIIKTYIEYAGPKCSLNWIDVSGIDDMYNLFRDFDFNGDISKWDTHNVTDMSYMFSNSNFNGDISKWDTSNVINMSYMFQYSLFNGDISKWDVSNVENMASMFKDSKFNGDISKWDTSNVRNMRLMFYKCKIDDKYKPKTITEL